MFRHIQILDLEHEQDTFSEHKLSKFFDPIEKYFFLHTQK